MVDASLRVGIASLLGRKPIFSAGRLYSQQDGKRSSRTPISLAGRVNFQQDWCNSALHINSIQQKTGVLTENILSLVKNIGSLVKG
jgi:hypothetical protein